MNSPFGNMGDMMNMMKQAQEQAAKMAEEMEKKLAATMVDGSAGGGMVTIKMTANNVVKEITIDPEVIDKNEKEMLEDLVVAALNQALKKAKQVNSEASGNQMGDLSKGLGGMPGMGGIDLSKMFGG
ncbi:MAG: YbaB/EbfC family nucleoid-associated protein [Planctomycetota bacterium]|nr:YbaB/EbfC family nucleoid-associated protein [Planctomycetota bacterium]